jgi:hypothetical protein
MRSAALAALLLLSACQPLPHPFADDHPPPNSPVLTPPDSAGIMVERVTGAPDPTAQDLAAAMAVALQDADVPASTDASNRGSYHLTGTATADDAGGGNLKVTLAWEMHEPGGKLLDREAASEVMPAADWRKGGSGVAGIARQSAPALAKLVENNLPPPAAGVDPLIAVRGVTGAPGDGGEALARAMSEALRQAKLALADKPGEQANFVLQGTVTIAAPKDGKQDIKILWALLRPDGGKLGEVNQENAVPSGSLDGAWGLTAYDIANAAAPGIAALIAEAQRSAAAS